jgi:hypothetical protein
MTKTWNKELLKFFCIHLYTKRFTGLNCWTVAATGATADVTQTEYNRAYKFYMKCSFFTFRSIKTGNWLWSLCSRTDRWQAFLSTQKHHLSSLTKITRKNINLYIFCSKLGAEKQETVRTLLLYRLKRVSIKTCLQHLKIQLRADKIKQTKFLQLNTKIRQFNYKFRPNNRLDLRHISLIRISDLLFKALDQTVHTFPDFMTMFSWMFSHTCTVSPRQLILIPDAVTKITISLEFIKSPDRTVTATTTQTRPS